MVSDSQRLRLWPPGRLVPTRPLEVDRNPSEYTTVLYLLAGARRQRWRPGFQKDMVGRPCSFLSSSHPFWGALGCPLSPPREPSERPRLVLRLHATRRLSSESCQLRQPRQDAGVAAASTRGGASAGPIPGSPRLFPRPLSPVHQPSAAVGGSPSRTPFPGAFFFLIPFAFFLVNEKRRSRAVPGSCGAKASRWAVALGPGASCERPRRAAPAPRPPP